MKPKVKNHTHVYFLPTTSVLCCITIQLMLDIQSIYASSYFSTEKYIFVELFDHRICQERPGGLIFRQGPIDWLELFRLPLAPKGLTKA